jgi:hypothetical protein
MAQRGAGKAKRRVPRADAPVGRAPAAATSERGGATAPDTDLRERIRLLEAELAKVKSELAAALARSKILEGNQEQVRNRIDWVIDSLHNLMDE